MRHGRIDRAIAAVAAVAATLLLTLGTPQPAAATSLGAATDLTWGIPRGHVDRTLGALRRARVRSLRINASWTGLEPARDGVVNPHYLADLDYAVRSAREAGFHVLLQVGDSVPFWASADPLRVVEAVGNRLWNRHHRPRDFADYADFAGFLARRYAPLGVHSYELWNEPNAESTWPSGPDPAEYAELLRAGADAVRREDRRATIVLGGLAGNDHAFLQGLYDAGAARAFDVVAVHPYTGSVRPGRCWRDRDGKRASDAFCGLDEIRATMRRNRDARTPVWVTEFGWTTYRGRFGVSEHRQARYLREAVRMLDRRRWIRRAYWYSFRNTAFRGERPDDFLAHYGLLRTDFSAKPAFRMLRRIAVQRSKRRPPR